MNNKHNSLPYFLKKVIYIIEVQCIVKVWGWGLKVIPGLGDKQEIKQGLGIR